MTPDEIKYIEKFKLQPQIPFHSVVVHDPESCTYLRISVGCTSFDEKHTAITDIQEWKSGDGKIPRCIHTTNVIYIQDEYENVNAGYTLVALEVIAYRLLAYFLHTGRVDIFGIEESKKIEHGEKS